MLKTVFAHRVLTAFWSMAIFFAVNGALCAKEKETEEPLWVMSWAAFFLFLGIAIYFLGRPGKRRESLLTEEEEKEYMEKLGQKWHDYYKTPTTEADDE